MPRSLTNDERRVITADGATFAYLLELRLKDGSMLRFANKPGIRYKNQSWVPNIMQVGAIRFRGDSFEQDRAEITLQNVDLEIARLIETDQWRGAIGYLYQYFHAGDFAKPIFFGFMAAPSLTTSAASFLLVSPFDPAVRSLPAQVVSRECRATFAAPFVYGLRPLCPYGQISPETGRRIGHPLAQLSANMTADQTTMPVFTVDRLTPGDYVKIDHEIVFVESVAVNPITVQIARGQAGTIATSHQAGAFVFAHTCQLTIEACRKRGMFNETNEHRFTIVAVTPMGDQTKITVTPNPNWTTDRWVSHTMSNVGPVGYPVVILDASDNIVWRSRVLSNDDNSVTVPTSDVNSYVAPGKTIAIEQSYFAGFPNLDKADLAIRLPGTLGAPEEPVEPIPSDILPV